MAQDEKFDLEKYLQMLAAADLSEAPAGEERTTCAPEQGEAPPQEQPYNRANIPDSGNSAVSAARADDSPHLPPAARAVAPVTHTPPPPEPERSAGEVAPSVRAPTPPDTSSVPNPSATEESFSIAQERTPHSRDVAETSPGCGARSGYAASPRAPSTAAQADGSLYLPPAARAVGSPYRGEVAGGSPAAERRRPNRAPPVPQPRPSLHSLTRALDRELRRYG